MIFATADSGEIGQAIAVVFIVLVSLAYGIAMRRLIRKQREFRRALYCRGGREWLLWIGDGMAPAGPHLIGRPVNINGRTGKVVDATLLKILVEWD